MKHNKLKDIPEIHSGKTKIRPTYPNKNSLIH